MAALIWTFQPPLISQSDHGYSILKFMCDGKVKFQAWPPPPRKTPKYGNYQWQDHVHHCIDVFKTADLARTACQEHFDRSKK